MWYMISEDEIKPSGREVNKSLWENHDIMTDNMLSEHYQQKLPELQVYTVIHIWI